MFKTGEIVYHDNYCFPNGKRDHKEKRPCVVLFEEKIEDVLHVCTCPLTSKVASYRKKPEEHFYIPELIMNDTKESFATISCCDFHPAEETHSHGYYLPFKIVKRLVEEIRDYEKDKKDHLIVYIIRLLDILDRVEEEFEEEEEIKRDQRS